uniref:RING-type domain-containing protein n=1 Tax=Strigamia maritima TaxID=126957 RepID=T1J8S4_STRMM
MAEGSAAHSESSPISELQEITNRLTRSLQYGAPYNREENQIFTTMEEDGDILSVLVLSRPTQEYPISEIEEIGRIVLHIENREFARLFPPQFYEAPRFSFWFLHGNRYLNSIFDDLRNLYMESLAGYSLVPLCNRQLKDNDVLEVCVICLLEQKCGQLVKDLPCSHVFHSECIDTWLEKNHSCPLCRTDLRQNSIQ